MESTENVKKWKFWFVKVFNCDQVFPKASVMSNSVHCCFSCCIILQNVVFYIIYCFWNNTFYKYEFYLVWVLHLSLVTVFIRLIIEFSQRKLWITEPNFKNRESFDNFHSPILQPIIKDPLFSYHFKTLIIKNDHLFVYNSKGTWTTLN